MTIAEVAQKYGLTPDTLRYYERIGMIPPVPRTAGGIRDYGENDCKWIELALCMRGAGLPIETMIEYVRLYRQGDETIPARLELLTEQRQALLSKRADIDRMLDRLNYKIARYEEAARTGKLEWNKEDEQ